MATSYRYESTACDAMFADDFLLPCAAQPEQSTLLPSGKILMVIVDPHSGDVILTRHLRSGRLDDSFGVHGVQRLAAPACA